MKFRSLVFSTAVALGFVACSDETTVFNEAEKLAELEVNQETLTNSISFDKAGVLGVFEEDKTTGKFSKEEDGLAGDYPLTLVAQVQPPTYNGNTNLAATHIAVEGDYAYVSYNTQFDTYAGAIDIVRISDPHNPQVTARLNYTNADINSVTVSNGYVYAAGSVDAELSVTATENSFVAKISVANGSFNLNDITYGFQKGKAGTDVLSFNNKIYATSGKEGTLTVYNAADMMVESQFEANDLLSVAKHDNKLAVLDGDFGVTVYNSNLEKVSTIAIDTDLGIGTKKNMDFTDTKILVPEANKGVGVYNFASGNRIKYIAISAHPDADANGDNVTNAISKNENVVMIANGAAGLALAEEKEGELSVFGVIDIEGSVNYVTTKNDYVFAATGTEGLQIIKLNRPSESLETKCTGLSWYRGSSNLVVNAGDVAQYTGYTRFNSVTTSGELLLCGSWSTRYSTTLEEGALFEMRGSYYMATNNRRSSLTIKKDATFRVEGNLYVYGDVILEEGATLEFLGEDSVVNVFGSVTIAPTAKVIGEYRDVRNKF
ncbi:hypothetical protein [Cellulophaga omnivescoria]|uniref:hypothetical protein n=1 Tax=Cellulophaga omnivescoria TaxID=1888890 RepID=UPI000986388A|nr:hypothetical protein [Cellulophaga omnivescoria]WBU88993.1 hypothetical protein PBN93_14100 [Cellulophaga omnivescoria]WKB80967.1 hypothetical protein QYR09_14575 [Cellulophaga lytica]